MTNFPKATENHKMFDVLNDNNNCLKAFIPLFIRISAMKSTIFRILFYTSLFIQVTHSFQIHQNPTKSSSSTSRIMSYNSRFEGNPHVDNVLFIECGFGNDSHGQNSTKAAVRACRNAIEFNSIPSIKRLVPGGYDSLKLDVLLAVPPKYRDSLDLTKVQEIFPYGSVRFQIQEGGMVAPSGIAIDELGDKNDDMVVV